jgi:hypothetical protein
LGGVAEIIWIVIIVGIVGSVIIVWRSISVPIITAAAQKLHISVNANVQSAATVFPLDDGECATESTTSFLTTLMEQMNSNYAIMCFIVFFIDLRKN